LAARRLTVLQVLPALQSGGVERGTLEVAAALVAAGHRSLVLSAGGRLVRSLCEQGSAHIEMALGKKSPLTLLHIPALRRLLRQQRVDILHVRSRMPAWIAWLAWRGLPAGQRPRFITTVHGLYSVNAYSRIMTRGERVIAVSDTARRYLLEHYPAVEPQRVITIPRGVDRTEFPYGYRPAASWRAAWLAEFPPLATRRVLTLPGRLTRLKGHEDFIDLVAALVAAGCDVHGLIVGHLDPGRARYIDALKQRIADLGITDRITFTGQRKDMKEIYAVSDLVLSLSGKPESFGRTVLEALALGVPVLGYDHGGVGEILAACFPSGRVARADSQALLKRSLQLLDTAQAVPECGEFALSTMLERTLALYRQLADELADGSDLSEPGGTAS
jgi:glycosyltransferase involved in cell wall biosynthesis